MATLIVQQLIDIGLRSSPMRLSSIQWRLGLIGGGAASIAAVLLAFFVSLCIAVAADDSVAAYILSILSGAAAGLCILAIGVFSLDALQIKAQVLASVSSSYNAASAWVVVRLVLSTIMFLMLAISAFRAARTSRREASPKIAGRNKSAMLVGAPRAPAGATPGQQAGADLTGSGTSNRK
jgi:hypothetical protein